MDEETLKFYGFKRKGNAHNYWFELIFGQHKFITSDNNFKKGKFIIGYENLKDNEETCWFNSHINHWQKFDNLFKAITGHACSGVGNHKKLI